MLTQTIPALIDALRQVLPPEAIGPLAQALGNCGQPLSHRAGVNFVAPQKRNANGTYGGNVYGNNSFNGGGAWDPSLYQYLFPGGDTYNSGDYHNQVDIGGMNVTWNEGNRYDSQFYFPTNQVFQQNQYFGGPTVNITGGQQVDYITNQYFDGDTVNVQNVTTEVINGDPVAGPQGPPGAPGRDGQRGAPGAPGVGFGALPPGFFGPIRYLTGNPKIRYTPERVSRAHRYIKDAWVRQAISVRVPTDAISDVAVTVAPGTTTFQRPTNSISGGIVQITPQSTSFELPTNAISGGIVQITPQSTSFALPTNAISGGTFTLSAVPVTVPLTVSFDPATCTVNVDSTTTIYALPSSFATITINGTPAATQTRTVASTASVTGTLQSTPAATETVYVASTATISATVSTTAASTMTIIAATTAASTWASVVTASGFVIKGQDADFWERAPASVVVSREPRLADINPANARVYQQ